MAFLDLLHLDISNMHKEGMYTACVISWNWNKHKVEDLVCVIAFACEVPFAYDK